jgi:hypothetical protein
MAGLDSFLWLTPILMLAVVALLVFVGCDQVFGLNQASLGAQNLQANPGFPAPGTRVTPADLTWDGTGDATLQVYRAVSPDGPFTNIGESSSSAYTDGTVTDGTTSYYLVLSVPPNAENVPVAVTPQPPFVFAINPLGAVASNLSSFLGMEIKVGGSAITVYALGRFMIEGNKDTHELQIVDASNNSVVVTVLVNMAGGTPGSFVYTALPTPVTLNATTNYYVVSLEELNGDQWHNDLTMVVTTSDAIVTASIEGNGTTYTKHNNTAGATFGPLDFLYL